jgi:hypothetical protein
MATKIVTKNSSTASAVPTASDLVQGELAVNVADKRLFTEDNAGAIVELGTNPSGNVTFQDNGKAIFGAGSDLQIYHDGSNNHTFVKELGSGNLYVQANNLRLQSINGGNYAQGIEGDAFKLYFNDGQKLATTATGIDVTGTATMDGLTVDTSSVGGFKVTNEATSGVRLTAYQGTTNSNVRTAYVDAQEFVVSTGTPTGTTVTERMRIDSSGNVLVGTTSTTPWSSSVASSASNGLALRVDGVLGVSSYKSTANAGYVGYLNRTSTDGGILAFNKDGTTVGSISTSSGRMAIGTGNTGLFFDSIRQVLTPHTMTGNTYSTTIDLGRPIIPFKDLYLSGASYIPDVRSTGTQYFTHTTDVRFRTSTGTERMRIDSSGNVGIGTSSPSSELHISSAAPIITATATNNNSGLRLNVVGGGIELLRLQDNGTERLRVDSSGNVGIGITPTRRLHVYGASGAVARITGPNAYNAESGLEFSVGRAKISGVLNGSGGTPGAALRFYTMPNSGSVTERMRIDSSGNVGIGRTEPQAKLHLQDTGDVHIQFTDEGNIAARVGANGNALVFGVDGANGTTERMRIDSSGNVQVGFSSYSSLGTVNTGCRLSHDGQTNALARNSNGVVLSFYSGGGGAGNISVTNNAAAYNTSSDKRLKENIADANDAGSKIDAIQVRQYDWKADGSHQDYGMIAQELLEVAPEAVSQGETEEEMMGVDYSKLVPMLVKEIQSLRNRVAQLEE